MTKGSLFIRTKFHINRLTQTYFTAFLYIVSDRPSYNVINHDLDIFYDKISIGAFQLGKLLKCHLKGKLAGNGQMDLYDSEKNC